jgi:phosphoribosylaminoimidazole-succinocarboxamide synthase
VLTRLSAWWFNRFKNVVPTHFISLITAENAHDIPLPLDERYFGRTMLVKKAKRLDAECVVRGYITGSGWKEYQRTQSICGIALPAGLQESERFQEPIFTPTTKAEVGHDEPITFEQLVDLIGEDNATATRVRSLATYNYAAQVALERGIILADTKFEFGIWNEEVILIDEVLTPDSSRFWPAAGYKAGGGQPSFDKQPIRDWLAGTGWKDTEPPPAIPDDVVAATTTRYLEAYRMLTGEELPA